MKLTKKQKNGVFKAVVEHVLATFEDDWGEPWKDVDQSDYWPTCDDNDEYVMLSEAADAYLDTATRKVLAKIKAIRP